MLGINGRVSRDFLLTFLESYNLAITTMDNEDPFAIFQNPIKRPAPENVED
jgi:hypothetical protein